MLRMFTTSRTTSCVGILKSLARRSQSNLKTLVIEKKKKKLGELTPQEIEIELRESIKRLRKCIEKDENKNIVVPVFKKALLHVDQVAIKDTSGEYTYLRLYVSAKKLSTQISNLCSSAALSNVGYICENNILSPLAQWACWMSGQVAMPLSVGYSPDLLRTLLEDSKSSLLIVSPEHEILGKDLTEKLDIPLLVIDPTFVVPENTTLTSVPRLLISVHESVFVEGVFTNDFYEQANALLLYTPGTTGKVKGVMLTHRNLNARVKSLVNAWKCDSNDCLMHALPMNNIHGAVNTFMVAMSTGARIVMQNELSSHNIWSNLLGINKPAKERVNVFITVPPVYNALLAEYEKSLAKNIKMVDYISNYFKENVRLMASCSAPLPPAVFNRWRDITGHNILESYGSTECGLVMSSAYETTKFNDEKRQPGIVGLPLPDVRARLVGPQNEVLIDCLGVYKNNKWDIRFLESEEVENVKITAVDGAVNKIISGKESLNRSTAIASFTGIFSNVTDALYITATKLLENLMRRKALIEKKLEEKEPKWFEKMSTDEVPENKEMPDANEPPKNKPTKNYNDEVGGIFSTLFRSEDPKSEKSFTSKSRQDPNSCASGLLLGELQIAAPQVFKSYFGSSENTTKAFVDEFYRTGDIATFQDGSFKILGRSNIDVIEIAGKKISCYDIESLILEHPSIRDVAVVKLLKCVSNTSTEFTDSIGVVCVLNKETGLDLNSLNIFCSKSLPNYLLPKKLKIVDELPHSKTAKIDKQALRKLFHEACDGNIEKDTAT